MLSKYARVADRFRNRRRWNRRPLSQMAEEVGQGQLYETFYRWASAMHHVSIGGVMFQVGADSLDVNLAPSTDWLEEAVITGMVAMTRLTKNCCGELRLGLEEQVDSIERLGSEVLQKLVDE